MFYLVFPFLGVSQPAAASDDDDDDDGCYVFSRP